MAKLYDFPNRGVIEDEACEWLIKLDRDEPLSNDEIKALREWIAHSDRHRQEFERLARLWGRMNVLTELAVPLDRSVDSERGILKRPAGFFGAKRSLAVAATVVVVSIAVLMANRFLIEPVPDVDGVYVSRVGEVKKVVLPDGSVVELNTNSSMRVDYDSDEREIRLLRGEGFFEVASDSVRPFVVYAANGRVEAVGTAFTVYLKDSDVQVTVTEGQVDLAVVGPPKPDTSADNRAGGNASQTLGRLSAGQSTTISNSIGAVHGIEQRELVRKLAWRQGMLMFSGEPLEEVVSEISRYTDIRIRIADPAVRELRIGGRFKVGEVDAMFEVLESSFGIRVTRVDEHTVRLSAKSQ